MAFLVNLKYLKTGVNAIPWTNYIVDGIVLIVLIGFAIYCGRRGFIDCFFSFASTTIALIVAVTLAKICVDATNGLFGLNGWLEGVFTDGFAKISGFEAEIGAEGADAALKEQNIPAIITQLVFKLKGEVPEGTTIAMALGEITASLTCYLGTGILLFLICKLLLLLVRNLLNSIMERVSILDKLNTILGVAVGILECLLIVCTVLSVLAVIPSQAINNYLDKTLFLRFLYQRNPLVWLFGLLI